MREQQWLLSVDNHGALLTIIHKSDWLYNTKMHISIKFYPKLKFFSFVSNHSDYTLPAPQNKKKVRLKTNSAIYDIDGTDGKELMESSCALGCGHIIPIAFRGATTEKLSGIVCEHLHVSNMWLST